MGILNASHKFFLVVYEPILKLQGLECVGFQGENCFNLYFKKIFKENHGWHNYLPANQGSQSGLI